jgi:hypothetical protein
MKIIRLLQKLEYKYITKSGKILLRKNMAKGNIISVLFFDIDKEQLKLLNFMGLSRKYRAKGFNTKVRIRILVRRVYAEQEFFLYSKIVGDAGLVRKKI